MQRFRIILWDTGEQYNVYRFSGDIYFIRSFTERNETAGYLKGTSIWKSEETWVSPSGQDEKFISAVGQAIERHLGLAEAVIQ